jgi:hypothetical protein
MSQVSHAQVEEDKLSSSSCTSVSTSSQQGQSSERKKGIDTGQMSRNSKKIKKKEREGCTPQKSSVPGSVRRKSNPE